MLNRKVLSHRDALAIVEAILAEVERRDEGGAAIAIVDVHGELHAFLRTDGCRLSCLSLAMNKAFTAAREEVRSGDLAAASREGGFPMTNFGDLRFLSWPGGIPIRVDGEVIGAVGVSGLPDEVDVELAERGAAVIGR